ncbi:MAG TPA: two-component regulator propeller domain-containing protein, partial [Candidatus Krumholzibacteria bacterium]|nr:two-component regulator propeller domain-containing protein [Candidatus Krumholzibacteria bacterium]
MRTRSYHAGLLVLMGVLLAPAAAPAQYRWRNHIDASAINEIVAHEGRLYMATFGGLLVYDPAQNSFEQYDNTTGLPSNALTCLFFTPDGTIYIGTDDIGVAKVRISAGGKLSLIRSLNEQIDGLASNRINSIAGWGEDVVYGSTPGAGTIRNDFASARFFARDGLPADDVKDVLPDGDVVLLATEGGLAVLDKFGLLRRPSGGPSQSNVLGSDGSRIWVGTSDGVWRLDPGDSSWTNVGPATRPMDALHWDGTTMWGGSTRNFFRYTGSGTSWTIFRADTVLARYGFTGGNGANRMKGLVVSGSDVYLGGIVAQDRRGPGFIHYDGATMRNIFPNTPGANDIIRLSRDVDGAVWASFRYYYVGKLAAGGQWLNYNPAQLLPAARLPSNQSSNTTLLADADGIKWISTLSTPAAPKPLDALDDQRDTNFQNDVWQRNGLLSGGGDGLGSLRPQRAVEDPAGNRWFLSDNLHQSDGWWGINILSKDHSAWLQMNPGRDGRMLEGNVSDVAFGPTSAYIGLLNTGVQVWSPRGYDWTNLSNIADDGWSTVFTTADKINALA